MSGAAGGRPVNRLEQGSAAPGQGRPRVDASRAAQGDGACGSGGHVAENVTEDSLGDDDRRRQRPRQVVGEPVNVTVLDGDTALVGDPLDDGPPQAARRE